MNGNESSLSKTDVWLRASLLAAAAAMLGRALQISNGIIWPDRPLTQVYWMLAALITAAAAVLVPLPRVERRWGAGIFICIASLCLAANFAQLGERFCAIYLRIKTVEEYAPFQIGCGAAAVLAGIVLATSGWLRHAAFWLLLTTFFLLGVWLIRTSPLPMIDVYVFQRDSAAALAQGHNPYSITFRDIYQGRSPWYGPGISVNGVLQFGYPYMPASLLLTMPAHYFGVDTRYAQLGALILAAALLAYARPSLLSFAAAIMLLSMPRLFFVLEQSWTEPFVVLLLAATVFCALRLPWAMPVALGLFIASKQYVPAALVLVPLILLIQRDSSWAKWAYVAIVVVVAALVTLPLALWDWSAFWKSAVTLQMNQPYRPDSLSLLAWYGYGNAQWRGPAWLAFAVLALTLALSLWRSRRGAGAFAAAVALCFFMFFAFNKQAFANYYFFVVGALFCAIAGMAGEVDQQKPCASLGI